MKPIGGYFEWEFPHATNSGLYDGQLLLNSCRHAFEYILQGIGKVSKVWIPYFTCEVILEPLKKLNISYNFYHINESLEIDTDILLSADDFLVYTNYYGIKDNYVKELATKYGSRLIIDNAQALYCAPHNECHQIYSPRKFIGMPDGGLAVTPLPDRTSELPIDQSYERCSHLLKRLELHPSEGYYDFQKDDAKISQTTLSRMSVISQKIFQSANFDFIKEKRKDNFSHLHRFLQKKNKLNIPPLNTFESPLVYPFWTSDKNIKQKLIESEIYVATFWPNVFKWSNSNDLEYQLASMIICLPVDQRYGIEDMNTILFKMEEQ